MGKTDPPTNQAFNTWYKILWDNREENKGITDGVGGRLTAKVMSNQIFKVGIIIST